MYDLINVSGNIKRFFACPDSLTCLFRRRCVQFHLFSVNVKKETVHLKQRIGHVTEKNGPKKSESSSPDRLSQPGRSWCFHFFLVC